MRCSKACFWPIPDVLRLGDGDPRAIVRADAPVQGKVGLATGGGSGHLPVFLGYVGKGLLDGCAVGNVFASPNPEQMLSVTRAINGGKGVLYIYGNYGGDVMNFDMATEMAAMEDIEVRTVLVAEDVASAPPERARPAPRRGRHGVRLQDRRRVRRGRRVAGRGGGGHPPCPGQYAHHGRGAGALYAARSRRAYLLRSAMTRWKSAWVSMASRASGAEQLEPADSIAERLLSAVLADLDVPAQSRVAVMINGLGATPAEELYILYRHVHRQLAHREITVHRAYVGEYATSLEMAGASLTVLRLDDQLAGYLDAPAESPFFVQTGHGDN